MNTENLQTLKIHKLTQTQYDRELAAGNIDENALYLTPDEEIDLSPYATIEQVNAKADANHNHDNVYYTETEVDALLSDKAASSHVHAIGEIANLQTRLDGKADTSHTHDGYMTSTNPVGTGSFSMNRKADSDVGDCSSTSGENCTASGSCSHAEGYGTTASGSSSHAEGLHTDASGDYSHAEGSETEANGNYSHAEGYYTKATGWASHAEGSAAISDNGIILEYTTASGAYSHAEGYATTASNAASHAEGNNTVASAEASHAEGANTESSGIASHAEGLNTIANGDSSHAAGYYTTAEDYQYVVGKYNSSRNPITSVDTVYSTSDSVTTTYPALFIIGNGTSDTSRSNAFTVYANGKCKGLSSFGSSGADYARQYEWLDGNPNNEDRRGLLVVLDGSKIRIATSDDDIEDCEGIVSTCPAFVENDPDEWHDRYLKDVFGRRITQEVIIPEETITKSVEKIDEETGKTIIEEVTEVVPEHTIVQFVVNPEYDPEQEYICRDVRPEWTVVGFSGFIVAVDDGTCQVNGYCTTGENGVLTMSETRTAYRVMERKDDNHILVRIK